MENSTVAIIGAGPIGLELAIALKQVGIPYLLFDKGQIGHTISEFPPQTHFFSSNERIGIAGIPLQTLDQQKSTREEYLTYLRAVVMHFQLKVNSYEEVILAEKNESGFHLVTQTIQGQKNYHVRFLVLATGGTAFHRRLNVPGEDQPHVLDKMEEPHQYFQKRVLIVGGRNSAAEDALRCYHAGAQVTLSVRAEQFDADKIKYWLLPELTSLIAKKKIVCHFHSDVVEIQPGKVILIEEDRRIEIEADFVIKAIGFTADMHLFHQLGAELSVEQENPVIDHETMETTVPDLYVAGTALGGTQKRFLAFIENSHHHPVKIVKSISKKLGLGEVIEEIPVNKISPSAHLEE